MIRLALVLALLLTSCGLPTKHHAPNFPLPECWKWPTSACEGETICEEQPEEWWFYFDDPLLHELIGLSLEHNQTLEQAYHRMREARAMACSSCSYLWPTLTLDPSITKQESVVQNPLMFGPNQMRFQASQYELPLTVSYDVDLWQKYTHQCLAGNARAGASLERLAGTQLLLTTDVAQTYYKLRELDTERQLLEATIVLRKQSVELTRSRFTNGIITRLDVSRAELLQAETEADLADIVRQRAIQENALAVLCGSLPSNFTIWMSPLFDPAPPIPADLPSDVLQRRPDIAEAERNLAALYSDIGVSYASLFPSLHITGQIGYSSPELNNLLKWQSNMWALAMNASQTIFDAGRNCANLRAAHARYCQGIANYRQTIMTAFQEVENALASIHQNAIGLAALERQVLAAKDVYTLTHQRYKDGIIISLDVVDAERVLLDTQRQEVRSRGQQFLDAVQLVKALGGSPRCVSMQRN